MQQEFILFPFDRLLTLMSRAARGSVHSKSCRRSPRGQDRVLLLTHPRVSPQGPVQCLGQKRSSVSDHPHTNSPLKQHFPKPASQDTVSTHSEEREATAQFRWNHVTGKNHSAERRTDCAEKRYRKEACSFIFYFILCKTFNIL